MAITITGTGITMPDATVGSTGVITNLATMVGTANSISSYIVLPGNKVIVMGQVFVPNRTSANPTTIVTFPITFSSTPFPVVGSVYDNSTTGDIRPIKIDSVSTTTLTLRSSMDTLDFRCTYMVFGAI